MSKIAFAICALGVLTVGCSTPKLAWKTADGKDHARMYDESQACLRQVAAVPLGKFGNGREKAYTNCMYANGHQLVEE